MNRVSKICLWTFCGMAIMLAINYSAFGQDDGDWKRDTFAVKYQDGLMQEITVLYPSPTGKPGGIIPLVPIRVGIGTQRPAAKLHVKGGVVLGTDGSKVGIGTTNPGFQLSLGSSLAKTKLALYEKGLNNCYGLGVVPGAFTLHINGSGARFAFFNGDEADATEIVTFQGRGNVGIGRRNPETKLDVAGTTRTEMIEITGGSDLAEPFDIAGAESIQPGTVVCIDPEHPGQLRIASKVYDRTVAGIVSGANGLNPGLTMKQKESVGDGSIPVALTGRVYCLADVSNGPIQPGDLLTTSDTPGYAMKVTNYSRAQGAILGKAMSSLKDGKGLILVLVSLQ